MSAWACLLALTVLLFGKAFAFPVCAVYLSWPSFGRDLVEREVVKNGLTAEAECEKGKIPFFWLKSLKELDSVKGCREVYLFMAGHSEESLIGPYPPLKVKKELLKLRKEGVRFPLIVFDTCYWGKVYKERFFSFPETVVVGSPEEELQYGMAPLYKKLSLVVKLKGEPLREFVLKQFRNYYLPLYTSRGKELTEYGFRCQTIRTYFKGVVVSDSVCRDLN